MKSLSSATAEVLKPLTSRFQSHQIVRGELGTHADMMILQATEYRPIAKEYRRTNHCSAFNELLTRFPERKQLEDYSWMVPITDISTALVKQLLPAANQDFSEDLELALNAAWLRSMQHDINAEVYAAFKAHREVPSHNLVLHPERPLTAYQVVGAINAMRSEGYALFMEQGTGKTATAIAALCNRALETDGIYRALIVTPNNVRQNWKYEFEKFSTIPTHAVVMRGLKMNRLDCLLELTRPGKHKLAALICGYDTLCNDFPLIGSIPWNHAVLDEGHYIKSAKTRRWKFAEKLREIAERRLLLTGTPITNTMLDLYTQFEFLGKGYSGFASWKGFRSFYGVFDKTEDGFEKLVDCQNIPFMQERLARYSFLIRKEEALPDLPDKVYNIEEVEMSPPQEKAYHDLSSSLMIEIESVLESSGGKNEAMIVNNILTMLLRLAQITSGFLTIPEERNEEGKLIKPKEVRWFNENPKLERLVELLKEQHPLSKSIVWTCWVPDIKVIAERLEAEGIKAVTYYGSTSDAARIEAEQLFNNDDETKVFIGNPAAGGTGLNLLGYNPANPEMETNCDNVFYYAQNWSAVARSQSEDRAHRRGTRTNVRITDICIPCTIDEDIRARVVDKITTALEISDIRKILGNITGAMK